MSSKAWPRGPIDLDLEWLHVQDDSGANATPMQKAIDTAAIIFAECIDTAQHVIGNTPAERNHVLTMATAHAAVTAHIYAADALAGAIDEFASKVACAIREAGTGIGAGTASDPKRTKNATANENASNA